MTSTEAAKRLRISHSTFKWQARRLGIGRQTSTGPKGRVRRDFSDDDLDRLRELVAPPGLIDITDAARCLECSKTTIRDHARRLGIKPRPPFMYLFFTPDEIEQIRVAMEEAGARQRSWNRRQQHDALLNDRDSWDYYGHLRAFNIRRRIVQDPELSSTMPDGPQTETLQWTPFYPAEELAEEDTDTAKWGNMRDARKWISFDDLQQWHPDFKRDRY